MLDAFEQGRIFGLPNAYKAGAMLSSRFKLGFNLADGRDAGRAASAPCQR